MARKSMRTVHTAEIATHRSHVILWKIIPIRETVTSIRHVIRKNIRIRPLARLFVAKKSISIPFYAVGVDFVVKKNILIQRIAIKLSVVKQSIHIPKQKAVV